MSAEIVNLRTRIHRPIRPLTGLALEQYVDLVVRREDAAQKEEEARKEARLANLNAEVARLAVEAIDEKLAAINRQRGTY
jgi:hypothetical protein